MINPISKIATSKGGQRFYKWLCDPNKEKFFNTTLPTIESGIAGICYIASTELQPSIPREQKSLLNWQTAICTVGGMLMGSYCNRKAAKFVDKIAPQINKNIIDVHKIKAGLGFIIPAIVTCAIMRLALPVVSAQASAYIEDKRRKKLNKVA